MEMIDNNTACDDGLAPRVITMSIFAEAHSDAVLLWSISRDTIMKDEHSQWIGTACYFYGVFCRSTENAHHALGNPCGPPL